MSLHVHILDVVPETKHEGTVYENRVVVKVGAVSFGLFDPDRYASPGMIGEDYEIEVRPNIPTEVCEGIPSETGIHPDEEDPHSFSNHTFCGEVTSVSPDWPKTVAIELGSGSVAIEFPRQTPDHIEYVGTVDTADSGDHLCVTTSRTDLDGIR